MNQGAEQLYDQAMKKLAAPERFELASKLLQSIPPESVVDYSEEWSEEDIRDFGVHCRNRAISLMETDEQSSPS